MEITEALLFVGALWAVYLVVLFKSFGAPLKIYHNMLRSWTGSKLPAENKDIRGAQYVAFSLRNYKKVPWILKILRFHYISFKLILGVGFVSFLLFLGLGVFTAYVSWYTIGSPQLQIPKVQAQILIAGHIFVFFFNLGLLPFFRYFESRYAQHFYTIDENGERIRQKPGGQE